MEFIVKLLKSESVTPDVKRFIIERPRGYKFNPGQATLLAINLPEWKEKKRPFTFTSLNEEPYLEFIIKSYQERNGVTKKLHELEPGIELIMGEPWGTIEYKGKGTFIAGGAGITPFIAIFRQLQKEGKFNGNKLIFSNKTQKDIILEKELKKMFNKEDLILTLTKEKIIGYESKMIDKEFLKKYVKSFNQFFYICGPPQFTESIKKALIELGAKNEILILES